MKRVMSLPLKAASIFVFSTIFSTLSASSYNVYFSDPTAGMIYGIPDDLSGQQPAMVSGQLAINAWDHTQLDNNHLVYAPQYHTENLVEVDLLNGTLTEIYTLPSEWEVSAVGAGLTASTISVLAFHEGNDTLQIYSGTKSGGSWSFTTQGAEFATSSAGAFCTILSLSSGKFLVHHYETIEIIDIASSPQSIYTRIAEVDDQIVVGPSGRNLWFVYQPNETVSFYDFSGNTAFPPEEDSYFFNDLSLRFQEILWDQWSPDFFGRFTNQLYADDSPYSASESPTMIYTAHSGDGSSTNPVDLEKDISTGRDFYFTATNTWDYYDKMQNAIFQVNTDSDTKSQQITIEAGTGPSLGGVIAMDTSPTGIIHALCRRVKGVDIITIDPSTGDRTLVATGLPDKIYPAISLETDGSYHLFDQVKTDNAGTLESHLSLTHLTLGSGVDDYTTSSVTSVLQSNTPLDVTLASDGEGTALYPMSSGLFFLQSDGTSFSTYNGIPAYSSLQSRQTAVLSSGDIKLYGVFPPSIWDYDPGTSSLTQNTLTFTGGAPVPSELTYPADFIPSPDDSFFYLSCFNSQKIYAINATTGEASLFALERPDGLSGDLWGSPLSSPPVICCGTYIDLPYGNFSPANISNWFQY